MKRRKSKQSKQKERIISEDELRHGWQRFAHMKQKEIEHDIHVQGKYAQYLKADCAFNKILEEQNMGDTLEDMIRGTAANRERIASAIYYKYGFFEGIRAAMNMFEEW